MTQETIQSGMERIIGSLGIKGLGSQHKPLGTASDPIHVTGVVSGKGSAQPGATHDPLGALGAKLGGIFHRDKMPGSGEAGTGVYGLPPGEIDTSEGVPQTTSTRAPAPAGGGGAGIETLIKLVLGSKVFGGNQGGGVFNFTSGGDISGQLAGFASQFSGGGTSFRGSGIGPSGNSGDPIYVIAQGGGGVVNTPYLGGFGSGGGIFSGSGGSGGVSLPGLSGPTSTGSIPSSTPTRIPLPGIPPVAPPGGRGGNGTPPDDNGDHAPTGTTTGTTTIGAPGLPVIIFGPRRGGSGGGRVAPVDGGDGRVNIPGPGSGGGVPFPGGNPGDVRVNRLPDGTINRTGSVIGGVPPLGGINEGDPTEATGVPPGSPDTSDTGSGDTSTPPGSVDEGSPDGSIDFSQLPPTILDPPGSGNNPDPTGESGSDEENLVEPSTLAFGGPVFPNKPVIVGEGGEPEYYHPDSAGTVIPFKRLAALMRGGSFHGLRYGGALAAGGDVSPESGYFVGEHEPEFFKPHTTGRVTPLSKMGGGDIHNHITNHVDARGSDLGAGNRIQRSLEQTHRASVSSAVQASEERARRTVQVR